MLGATLVRIRVISLAIVEDLRCRFGQPQFHPFVVDPHDGPGSFDLAAQEVRCLTPPARVGPLPLEITLNGQQFSHTLISVRMYDPPRVEAVAPDSGPNIGGTFLYVTGHNLIGGEQYQCHFRGTSEAGTLVPATWQPESLGLRCQTPQGAAGLASAVEVTLNAQQFTNNGVRYSYYAELYVSSICPISGPLEGGTQLVVMGSGFISDSRLACRFASANFEASVPSIFVSGGTAHCVMPNTNGTSMRKQLVGSLIPRLLIGSAALLFDEQTHLGVVLNQGLEHFVVGTLFMNIHDVLEFASKAFSVRFNLSTVPGPALVHDGSVVGGAIVDGNLGRGDGWSFSYGDIAHGLVSERGAGLGLRIQVLLFTTNELRVLHRGHLLLSRNISVEPNENRTLLVRIEVQRSELSVHLGEQMIVAHLPLFRWQPQRSWRMAIGSRSGASASRHDLRGVAVAASSYEDGDAVSVELTANGVDYTDDLKLLSLRQRPSFENFTPATGSAGGGVPLTIFGSGLRGGSDYRAAFAYGGSPVAIVLASYAFIQGSDALKCYTPAYATDMVVDVAVTFNGQQYHPAGSFSFYDVPHLDGTSPTSGPVLGGTRIRVWGSNFTGGSVYRCRFNSTVVDAAFEVDTPQELSCRLPNAMPVGMHRFEVTLNGQEFTTSHLNFTVYGSSIITSLCPSSGPILGGSEVRILGAMLANGSHYLCRFGGTAVNASHLAGSIPHEVLCAAPRMSAAAVVPVELSLNGQNYTTSEILFTFHLPAVLTEMCPSTGPAHGGTTVHIVGAHLGIGSHYEVAIGDGYDRNVVPASFVPSPVASVRFVMPSVALGHLRVRASLNAQQFTCGYSVKPVPYILGYILLYASASPS